MVRQHLRLLFAGFAVLLGAASPALSQRYHVHTYTEVDGLPSSQIHSVAQGPDGLLWFATRVGVASYDGAAWKSYGVEDGLRVASQGLLELDGSGGLWTVALNRPLRVAHFDGERWEQLPAAPALEVPQFGFSTLMSDGRDGLLVGTRGGGLVAWDGEGWHVVELDEPGGTVFALARRDRALFVGRESGLWRCDLDRPAQPAERVAGLPAGAVVGLEADGDRLWVAGEDWIGRLSGDRFEPVSSAVSFDHAEMALAVDGAGGVYAAQAIGLFHVGVGGHVRVLDRSSGLIDNGTTDVLRDREGNVWVSSWRGLSKIVSLGIESFDVDHGLFSNEVTSILDCSSGVVLLGHWGGVTIAEGTSTTHHTLPRGAMSGRVMDLSEDDQGRIWIATTAEGVGIVDTDRNQRWFEGAGLGQVNAVVHVDGKTWIGAARGVFHLDEETGEFEPVPAQGDRTGVRRLYVDADGAVWAATTFDGLVRHGPDGVQYVESDDPLFNNTFCVTRTSDDRLLVGSQVGLLEVVDGELARHDEVAIDRPVYTIQEGAGGVLWIGTNHGVVRWDGQELRSYGPADGLLGTDVSRDAGWIDPEGRFWVGTDRGLSILPAQDAHHPGGGPTVSLLALDADGVEHPLGAQPLEVGPGNTSLHWHFRSISFVDERRVRFRYRLEGLEDDWVGPEPLPAREVRYAALSPGRYRLHLQAVDAKGRWSEVASSPAVVVRAPIYARTWFLLLVAAAFAALMWVGFTAITQRRYARRLEREVQRRTALLEESERTLAADRERLAITLASIHEGVVATDGFGRVFLWNRAASEATGRSEEQVLGQPLSMALGLVEDSLPAPSEPFEVHVEALFEDEEPSSRRFEISSAPLGPTPTGNPGAVVVFRDVTARRQLEHELSRAQRLESLGLLAGGIAHDFNNYLTVILGTIGMLKDDQGLSPEGRSEVAVAEDSLGRAVSLTNQLLTFARGGDPIRRSVSLERIVSDTVAFVLSGSAVSYSIEIGADLLPASIDQGQIEEVLHNLLLNARQAMPRGGHVHLRVRNLPHDTPEIPRGSWIELEIRDEGVGIPQEDLPHIFDPFFTRRDGGTGLGLAVAHSVVARHGGRMKVRSRPGEGTAFFVWLPASDRPDVQARSEGATAAMKAQRILVMDDEPHIRDLIARMLEKLGHEPTLVEHGEQAIEEYERASKAGARYDLAILDLTVPGGMGGREAAAALLAADPLARLVSTSGYSNDAVMGSYRQHGFVAALPKPFRLRDLEERLEQAFNAPLENPPASPQASP